MAKMRLRQHGTEMTSFGFGPPSYDNRSDWVRLRTLILLRWMAIAGQLAAIFVAVGYQHIQLPLGYCLLAIGASIIFNLVSSFVFPENKRLTEIEALLTLLFDLTQLLALIFLTGGLTNPFALLILAPVTISASALGLGTTIILGATAILMVTLNALYNIPLRLADGTTFDIPALFRFGFWLAIVIGILFLGLYSRRVALEIRSMSGALLATQMALAREQKLTDLGGVVAAAAHELGTPLATIKLVSAELMAELGEQPDLFEDAKLIRDQADRCRDILRSMGRLGKDDKHMHQAPLAVVLREASEPHAHRGKVLTFNLHPSAGSADKEPIILRSPEIIHGLRNLIQNAVDFAAANVWIDAVWSQTTVSVQIVDDGNGYPPDVIGRIGDPFVRKRSIAQSQVQRPEYEGMGLGLFIAKTLLERSGAELSFANCGDPTRPSAARPERCGAIVEVNWPISRIVPPSEDGLGENRKIEI